MAMAKKKETAVPMKQDINLAQEEKKQSSHTQLLIGLLCIVLGVGLFCKFGVIDRLNAVWDAERAADNAQATLTQVQDRTANYNEVLEEYRSYTALAEGVDPMKCLDLIEADLMAKSQVQSFSVADGLISAQISGVTLQQVSEIYADLMADDLVENVQVYTAATEDSGTDQVNANLTIQLAGASTDSDTNADTPASASGEGGQS